MPKFKKMNREVSCKIGQALEYHAEVDGDPMPEITWYVEAETKSFFFGLFFYQRNYGLLVSFAVFVFSYFSFF